MEEKERKVKAIKFVNALNSGIDVTIVHNPLFDGPLEQYENREDCEILTLKIKE